MSVFRHALSGELKKSRARGDLVFRGKAAYLADDDKFTRWIERMGRQRHSMDLHADSGVPVLAVTFADEATRLRAELGTPYYLTHYMNKVAIGNSRIQRLICQREGDVHVSQQPRKEEPLGRDSDQNARRAAVYRLVSAARVAGPDEPLPVMAEVRRV